MRLLVGFGPILVLTALAYPSLGAYVLIPLALGGVVAALFAARRDADRRETMIGLTAGVLTWAMVGLVVALLVLEFD